jgi:hypothetical protein
MVALVFASHFGPSWLISPGWISHSLLSSDAPCLREEQYRGSGDDDSFFSKMRKNILDWAQEHNHEVVEMNSIFSDHYVIHREKFNVSPDGLWNELGHKLAANAIRRRGIAQSLILSKG